VKKILRNIRGTLFFGVLTLNTIIAVIPVFILAVIKLLLPIPAVRRLASRLLMGVGELWVTFNSFWFRTGASLDVQTRGIEGLRRDGWYLLIANHQTWVDIVVLQAALNRRVPFLKFFIKQELIWFPMLGFAWWAMDMPFMKRYSASYLAKNPHMKGKDLETTRRACEKFIDTPTSVINFVEGTRFSDQKRIDRKSPYQHLLQPRPGGLAIALSSMGELFTSLVDVTMFYPNGAASFWDMCCGTPVPVIVDVREQPLEQWLVDGDYQGDREHRKRLHAWLGETWAEKDEIIAAMGKADG
jgi:1-acyl-sn-glycerol-3-phosphate acyltransferase